jgi:hypothetical protein
MEFIATSARAISSLVQPQIRTLVDSAFTAQKSRDTPAKIRSWIQGSSPLSMEQRSASVEASNA